MKRCVAICFGIPALLIASTVHADEQPDRPLAVTFNDCTEFAGIAPVPEERARALVPAPYQLVSDAAGAKLVVRVSDCGSVVVGNQPGRPGRVAHIGIMIQSPDGTATDPNTSINNYTLSYSSNLRDLVKRLHALGVPASLDARLAYEFSPAQGPSEFYAAVAPAVESSPTWFLHGTITNPAISSTFLANWWVLSKAGQTKMATTFPAILFDFTSAVSFYTSRTNEVGQLLGSNGIANFPVSFRGQYPVADMSVTLSH